jgi:hypothetical protein
MGIALQEADEKSPSGQDEYNTGELLAPINSDGAQVDGGHFRTIAKARKEENAKGQPRLSVPQTSFALSTSRAFAI